MSIYGLRKQEFSLISDEELDTKVEKITKEFPSCGENIRHILLGGKDQRGSYIEEFTTRGVPTNCGTLTPIIN